MDVVISISLSLSLNKLQDLLSDEETTSNPRLQKEIQTAVTHLHSVNKFLKDLEASSSGVSANDRRTAKLLKAVYSAEDATDTFLMSKEIQLYKKSRYMLEDTDTQKKKFFCSHKMKQASYPIRFVQKMKKFNDDVRRLVEIKGAETSDIENNNNTLLLRFQNDRDRLRKRQHWGRISDFCLEEEETHVVGLQQQINELVDRLIHQLICSDEDNEIQDLDDQQQHHVESIEVIAVAGEGGSGKTTLARCAYNRIDVKRHFTIRAWVRIPSVFRARAVLVDLLAQINQDGLVDETLSEDALMRRLRKLLKGTRFLIVLDDVETLQIWEYLVSALSFSSHEGSRIIIIVRSTDYLPENGYSTLNVWMLNNEDSWKLFSNKVRITEEELNNNSQLITLKEQILKICGGLPLTIVLLGGLLSTKEKSCDEWSRVL